MHPNPSFRPDDRGLALGLARDRAFGILTVAGPEGVLAAHIPFLLSPDGLSLEAHLVRSNPIARAVMKGEAEALMIVSGPDAYISPDWYGMDDQVPTWNYVAVHLRGVLSRLPDERLREHIEAISADREAQLLPKRPWKTDKMTPEILSRMMRQIMPVRLEITEVDATWKLNQNKTEEARLGAADALMALGGVNAEAEIAGLMQDPPIGA